MAYQNRMLTKYSFTIDNRNESQNGIQNIGLKYLESTRHIYCDHKIKHALVC